MQHYGKYSKLKVARKVAGEKREKCSKWKVAGNISLFSKKLRRNFLRNNFQQKHINRDSNLRVSSLKLAL